MAKKITQLTANLAPAPTDVLPIVDDPSGTPVTQKTQISYLTQGLLDIATQKTVTSGVLLVDKNLHKIQPESGTSDNIDSISGIQVNAFVFIYAADAGTDTFTIKHGTGNISCPNARDITFSHGFFIAYNDGASALPIKISGVIGDNNTLTAPTIADFTNANHDHLDTDDGGVITRGYTLKMVGNGGTPADATTYYFGNPSRVIAQTSAGNRRTYIPVAGTLIRAEITIMNAAGTVGSNETSTLYFRLNNTTDTTLSSAIINNQASEGATYISVTGLSVAVANTDYFELKWVTPTWTTNPTNSVIDVVLYFST